MMRIDKSWYVLMVPFKSIVLNNAVIGVDACQHKNLMEKVC